MSSILSCSFPYVLSGVPLEGGKSFSRGARAVWATGPWHHWATSSSNLTLFQRQACNWGISSSTNNLSRPPNLKQSHSQDSLEFPSILTTTPPPHHAQASTSLPGHRLPKPSSSPSPDFSPESTHALAGPSHSNNGQLYSCTKYFRRMYVCTG